MALDVLLLKLVFPLMRFNRRHNHSSVKLCMCHMESKVRGKFTVSLS